MKFLRTFVCILALSAYAGCVINQSPPSTLSYISSSQQTGQIFPTQQPQDLQMKNVMIDTPDGKVAFKVQVADTQDARTTGLMFRKDMPSDQGMVFLFDQEQPLTFWMKNTLIPLDMVFMDKDWKIVTIQKQAQPCKEDPCVLYPATRNAQYVLEINGGLSDKLGIQEGARVQLQS